MGRKIMGININSGSPGLYSLVQDYRFFNVHQLLIPLPVLK